MIVTEDSDEWLSELATVTGGESPTFGTDAFAQLAASFHAQTHGRSIDYRGVGFL